MGPMVRRDRPLLLILLLTAAAYVAVAGAGFVWDDQWLLVTNDRFRHGTLGDLLRGNLWAGTGFEGGVRYYRPLLLLTFYVDRELFGMAPGGWHLHSLAWHLVSVTLLYYLLRRLVLHGHAGDAAPEKAGPGQTTVSKFDTTTLPVVAGTLFFALHPVQSEAVTCIAARNDLLATAFVRASLLYLVPVREQVPAGRVVAGVVCYAAALLSKESAALLPLFVLMFDRARGLSWSGNTVRRYLAMGLGLVCVLILRAVVVDGATSAGADAAGGALMAMVGDRGFLLWHRLPTILATYGSMLVKPWPLVATRYLDFLPPGLTPERVAGLLVWVGLAVLPLLHRDRRRRAWALAAFACAVLAFAPALPAIATFKFLGERYLYLPLAFLAVWVAMMFPRRRWGRIVLAIAVTASLVLLHLRLPDWCDDLSLFSADGRKAPNCWNLTFWARALTQQGHPDEARRVLDPLVPRATYCTPAWGAAMEAALAEGDIREVVKLGEAAAKAAGTPVAQAPDLQDRYALALALLKRWDEAVQVAERVAERYPMSEAGAVLAAQRLRQGALAAYEAQARQWTDRRRMEVWVARLLARTGEEDALNRLRRRGIDPGVPVAPLEVPAR